MSKDKGQMSPADIYNATLNEVREGTRIKRSQCNVSLVAGSDTLI